MRTIKQFGTGKDQFWKRITGKELRAHLGLTALLYPKSIELLTELQEAQRKNPNFLIQIEQDYEDHWEMMTDDACGKMISPKMEKNGEQAILYLKSCIYPQGDCDLENVDVIITGNHTEASYLFLGQKVKYLILIDENEICYVSYYEMESLKANQRELEKMKKSRRIKDIAPKFATRYGKRIECVPYPYDDGDRTKLYQTKNGRTLIKQSKDPEKLRWMLKHKPKTGDVFAWPEKAVYRKCGIFKTLFFPGDPIGYKMKKRAGLKRIDEILVHESEGFTRLLLCLKLVRNVFYLHIQGILVTDYNLDNFQIDQNDNLIMLDCMEYTIQDLLGSYYAPEEQGIDFIPQYENRSDVIKAEYRYLQAVLYYILSNGVWPFEGLKKRKLSTTFEIAEKILKDGLTPYEMFCMIHAQCVVNAHIRQSDGGIYTKICGKNYRDNPNLKRCPVLVMVENSSYCEDQAEKIRECLKTVINEMSEDSLNSSLIDILVLAYAEGVHDIGFGTDEHSFCPLTEVKEKINNQKLYMEDEEAWLGYAVSWGKNILFRRKELYDDISCQAKMPTLIILGSFRSDTLNDPRLLIEKEIKDLNDTGKIGNWTVVKVKFEEEDSEFLKLIEGETIHYREKSDAKRILDVLHYSSSLILQ